MMMLYHEHDQDPEMRPEPISPEKREEVIVYMADGLLEAYRYFSEIGRSVSAPARVNHGAMLPRSGGTTRARAVRGRSTRNAAAGRR
jgi:hypothetical protein